MIRTLINDDQTIGVTIEDDGTVTIATRDDPTDMWGAPRDLREVGDGDLSEVARCQLVEVAWYDLTKGELQLTDEDDLSITEDGNVALYLWNVVNAFVTTFDVPQDDIDATADRAIAARVASALAALWYASPDWTSPNPAVQP